MADNIRLITYSEQTVTPMNDAIVYDAGIGKDGVLNGIEVTTSGNTISITGGYGVIRGRLFQIYDTQIPVTLSSGSNLLGRLYIRLDLSNVSEPVTIQTEVASSLSSLTQEYDANFTNGIFEIELAKFTVTSSEITDLTRTISGVHSGILFIETTDWSLDELVDAGTYYFDHEHTPTDKPGTVSNGWVQVLTGGVAKKQILWRQGSENTQAETWVRTFTSGAWTSWRRLVSENEMYYMPGQQTGLRVNCGGFLTSGRTYCGGFIPLLKPIHSSVQSVTVVNNTGYKVTIRQNDKYLVNEVNPTSLGATCAIRANGLDLNLNKSSGFGGINNDPVSIVGYIQVRFD